MYFVNKNLNRPYAQRPHNIELQIGPKEMLKSNIKNCRVLACPWFAEMYIALSYIVPIHFIGEQIHTRVTLVVMVTEATV